MYWNSLSKVSVNPVSQYHLGFNYILNALLIRTYKVMLFSHSFFLSNQTDYYIKTLFIIYYDLRPMHN